LEKEADGITAAQTLLTVIEELRFYKNYGIENRNIYQYNIGKTQNNLAFGFVTYC
jgi:outer membrane receptor for Fe3+-dicitrate